MLLWVLINMSIWLFLTLYQHVKGAVDFDFSFTKEVPYTYEKGVKLYDKQLNGSAFLQNRT